MTLCEMPGRYNRAHISQGRSSNRVAPKAVAVPETGLSYPNLSLQPQGSSLFFGRPFFSEMLSWPLIPAPEGLPPASARLCWPQASRARRAVGRRHLQ